MTSWSERAVAGGVLLLTVIYAPGLGIGQWPVEMGAAVVIGLAGLPLLVGRAVGARPGGARPAGERAAAGLLLAWLAVGLASALHAAVPALAMVGLYGQSAGWLFMAALAGCWALGTLLTRHGRALVAEAVVLGAVANAVVAVLQLTVGLSRLGLPEYAPGEPLGFQGNPVFLGGLDAAAVALVAVRFRQGHVRPRDWGALALVAVGVGAAGERMSMLVVLAVAVGVAVTPWWARRHRDHARAGGPGPWPSAGFAAAAVAATALGTLLPLVHGSSVLASRLQASAEGTFGDRLHAWLEGLRALAHQPLLGSGPGQFEAATSPLFPLWWVRTHTEVFTDAHNLFVEYAVTTGVLGLACLVAWAVFAVRGRRGALLGFAAALVVVEMVEPLNPVLTPLLFLAVGGAARRVAVPADQVPGDGPEAGAAPVGRPLPAGVGDDGPARPGVARARRLLWPATVVATAVGVLLACDLVVGSRAMADAIAGRYTGAIQAARSDAAVADRLLAPWPQSADTVAAVDMVGRQASPTAPTPLALVAHWQQVAAGRDPTDGSLWAATAQLQLQLGRLGLARADAMVSMRSSPWNVGALQILGTVALDRHDPTAARRWFTRLVMVRPQPSLGTLMRDGCGVGGVGGAAELLTTGGCR